MADEGAAQVAQVEGWAMSDKCTERDIDCCVTWPLPGINGKVLLVCMMHGVIGEFAFDEFTMEQARIYSITKMKDHLAEHDKPPTQEEIFEQTIQFFV